MQGQGYMAVVTLHPNPDPIIFGVTKDVCCALLWWKTTPFRFAISGRFASITSLCLMSCWGFSDILRQCTNQKIKLPKWHILFLFQHLDEIVRGAGFLNLFYMCNVDCVLSKDVNVLGICVVLY